MRGGWGRKVEILVFDDVEVLDFAGPYEVFSVTRDRDGKPPFRVRLVAPDPGTVTARSDLRVEPHEGLSDADGDAPTVLVVPGGFGVRPLLGNPRVRSWIRRRADRAEVTLSVCTGSLLLADAGLLAGKRATTHHSSYDWLRRLAPDAVVEEGSRWVDNGGLVTAAGVSAGIEASLHVVARLLGPETAAATARYIEYPWWERVAASTGR
jgi:transcriptional regulator GlxA family with amidase domain